MHLPDLHRLALALRPLRGAVLIAGLAAAVPGLAMAQAQPATLTLDEAIATARENNPSFLARQSDVNVARWQVRSASADFLPRANASTSVGYTQAGEQRVGAVGFGDRPPFYSSDYNLSVSLDLDGTKLLQPSVARANERATDQRVAGEEATLVSNVVQQYLTILQQQENVAQAEREVARTAEHVRLAEARLEVGAGTQLDVRRAEVQQGQAEIRRIQAQNALATATLALGQLMGRPLEPGIELTSAFEMFHPTWQTDELIQRAMHNNPGLLAARASADAAGTGVRQARSAYLPRLSFSTGLRGSVYSAGNLDPLITQQLNPAAFQNCLQQNQIREAAGLPPQTCRDPSNPADVAFVRERVEAENPTWPFGFTRQPISASVTVSLPLYTGLQRQVQVAQAQANSMDARYSVRAQELQLQTDVGTALRNLATAHETAGIQERVRATAAEELRLAQERFRFGAASSVEVTDAQTNLAESERALIEVIYDFHQSLAGLEALIGEPLR